jgi:hypothetical protein
MESGSEVKVKLDEFMKEPKAALKT